MRACRAIRPADPYRAADPWQMLRFGVHQLSLSFGRATGGKERNRGADTLGAVQGVVAVPRLDRPAWAVCQVLPGERLEFQAVGMVGGEKPSQGRVVLHETPSA